MNKLTIKKGNEKYDIVIEDYKIIIGNNYNMKFDILRTILKFYENKKASEFAEENNNIPQIYLDDQVIKTKDTYIFYIHKNYSLVNDFKLTNKSLIGKYLEILMNNSLFVDTINTINFLFESLSHEISDISEISGYFNSMTSKQLIKLMTPFYQKNEYMKDEYDLSLEEIILLQLDLIEYISDHSLIKTIICIDIPELTEKIYKKIIRLKSCKILLFVEHVNNLCKNISKYVFCERILVDVEDEEEFYVNICDNNYKLLNVKEGREYMEKYIFERETLEARFIDKLIK